MTNGLPIYLISPVPPALVSKAVPMKNNLAVVGREPSTVKIIGARPTERPIEERAIVLNLEKFLVNVGGAM